MRGDSVRDLYAKTLALFGLGAIAVAGALVDYWPVGLGTPSVATPVTQAPLPGPLSVNDVGVTPVPALPAAVAGPPSRPRVARAVVPARPAAAAPSPALLVVTAASLPLGAGVRLRQPGYLDPDLAVVLASHAPGDQDALAHLLISEVVEPPAGVPLARLTPAGPVTTGLTDEGDGLLTGAFKKAGSTIARTGAKTGASIFDTFRVVSGMVRRALPMN